MPPPPNPPAPNDPRRPGSKDHLPVAKLLPPLPAGPKPPSRPVPPPVNRAPAPPPPAADPGFEVVEDTAPRRSAHADTDAGFEVVDDEPAPPRKRKAAVEVDEDDDAPKAKKRRTYDDEDDADDEPRPKKKKKKKKKKGAAYDDDPFLTDEEREERERERDNAIIDWGVPGFLILVGLVLSIIAGVKVAGPFGFFAAIGVAIGASIVIIPVTVVALMVIGMLVGIEYGTPLSAIRNLAAIVVLVQGITWIGLATPFWIPAFLLTPLLTFGLFMTLFRLDVWETWVTVAILDGMQKVFGLLVVLVIFAALMHAADRAMKDPDPGGGGWNQPKNNDWQGGGQPKWGGPDDDDN